MKKNNIKKALVMGNGSSLDSIDFDLLKCSNVTTFACNRIAKICKKNDWYPNFYTAFFAEPFRGTKYPGTAEQATGAREDIKLVVKNENTKCYLHHWYREFLSESKNVEFHSPILVNRHVKFNIDSFQHYTTPSQFLWHIAVTPLFQLCFQMGFKTIGIIGQDGHKINGENYFKGYEGPDRNAEKIERGNNRMINLQNAVQKHANKNNVNIFNLSKTSIINHYPVLDIKDFLQYDL